MILSRPAKTAVGCLILSARAGAAARAARARPPRRAANLFVDFHGFRFVARAELIALAMPRRQRQKQGGAQFGVQA